MSDMNANESSKPPVILLEGVLDESAVFPSFNGPINSEVVIDVTGVRSINSIGINRWIKWMQTLTAQKLILIFKGLKENLALQFSMVNAMFPPGSAITSIEILMSCDQCGKEGKKLISFPKPLSHLKLNVLNMDKLSGSGCEKEDCEYEPSSPLSKTIGFLMR